MYAYQRFGDYFTLAGTDSPGLCEFDRADAPMSYDERMGYGLAGAWLFFKGEQLSKFGVRIRVFPGGHGFEDYPGIAEYIYSEEWQTFRDIYAKPPRGTRPKAMDLLHPVTAELGIKSVVTLNELQWKQTGDGEWTKEIQFCSYRAPRRALGKTFGEDERPVPTTALEQALQAAGDEVERLSRRNR